MKGYRYFHYQLRFIKLTVILKYRRFGKSSGVVVVTICAKNCQPFKGKSLKKLQYPSIQKFASNIAKQF